MSASSNRDAGGTARRRSRAPLWILVVVVVVAGAWGLQRISSGDRSNGLSRPSGPLNLLLITVDTTRGDYVGCYGRTTARTPNIDRLATEGVRFAQCTTASPLTLPSHSSIMTSVYPYVHGARRNGTARLVDANQTLAELLKEAGYATQATVASFVLNRRFGIDQGFDVYHDVIPTDNGDAIHAERKGDEVCDQALGMLSSVAEQPFFLWVHFYDPHHPYESERLRPPDSPEAYEDEISFADRQIGRLLERLSQLDLTDRTLVVVMGDHGEGLGEHEEASHGLFLYNSVLHVPLVLHLPGVIPAGRTVTAQVRSIDVAPTILDILGQAALVEAQGESLLPLVFQEKDDLELAAYSESLEAQVTFDLSRLRSLTAGRWKYILCPKPELYDLESDPGETQNVVDEHAELAATLRGQLRTLIEDAPPPLPPEDLKMDLSPDELKKLEQLGYVGGYESGQKQGEFEIDQFEPTGGDPKDYTHWFDLKQRSVTLDQAGEHQMAEGLLRELVAGVPDAPQLRFKLAVNLHDQGRIEESLEEYRKTVEMAPDDMQIRRAYGVVLVDAGRWDEAAEELDEVLKKDNTDFIALSNMGVARAGQKRFDEAWVWLETALKIEPKSSQVLHIMGVVRYQQGRLEEAIEYFEKALAIDPLFALCETDLNKARRELEQRGAAP